MPHTILRPYYLSWRNTFRFRARNKIGYSREILLGAVGLIIVVCIFFAVHLGLKALSKNPIFAEVLPSKMIELGCYYFLILLSISNTVAATGNIYSSERMSFLLHTPVSNPRLFFAKFIESFVETGSMFYVFTTPAMLAYMVTLKLPYTFILSFFALSVPFLAFPVGLGIILATFFARVIAYVWRRGSFFGFLALLALGSIFVRLNQQVQHARETSSAATVLSSVANIYDNPSPMWLPSRWVADLMTAQINHQGEMLALKLALVLAAPIGIGALAYLIFDLMMLRVRSSSSTSFKLDEEAASSKTRGDHFRRFLEVTTDAAPVDQQTRAIILKDLSSLLRDRALALQLILYLGISTLYVTVFSFMAYAMQLGETAGQLWSAVLATLNTIFSSLIFSTLMSRLVYPSVSLEGRAFWILQVTPIEIERLLRAKLACWLPITGALLVTLLCAGAIAIGLHYSYFPFLFLLGTSLTIGVTGLAIGIGARFATFDWEAPNQISVGMGTLVLLLLSITWVFIVTVPAIAVNLLIVVPDIRGLAGPWISASVIFGSLFFIVFGNLILARTSCRIGAQSLERERGSLLR